MNKRIRQYIGLLSAVLMYYIIHEGAHLIYALSVGAFRKINFMGLGRSFWRAAMGGSCLASEPVRARELKP